MSASRPVLEVVNPTHPSHSVIKHAAAVTSKTVTAFVLDAATMEAQRVVADRRLFHLDPTRWERFVNALDRPAKGRPRLRKLLRRPSILD